MAKSYPGGPGRVNIITPNHQGNQQERVCGFPTSFSPMFIAVGEVYAADLHNGTIAVAL
jgi:hypothetical protein